MFDECRFDNVDKCIAKLNEETIKRVGQLEEIARRLLGLDHPRARSSTSDSEGSIYSMHDYILCEITNMHQFTFLQDIINLLDLRILAVLLVLTFRLIQLSLGVSFLKMLKSAFYNLLISSK